MARVNELSIYIRRLVWRFASKARAKDADPHVRMLYLEANKQLALFDEEAWSVDDLDVIMIHHLNALDDCGADIEDLINTFVLFNMRIYELSIADLEIVSALASALEIDKIPANKYEDYLDMILYKPIYSSLFGLDVKDKLFTIMDILAATDYEDIKKKR